MTVEHLKGDMVACPHCLAHQDGAQVEDYTEPNRFGKPYLGECPHCTGTFWVCQLDFGRFRLAKTRVEAQYG
jgi:hypothetical protein